MGRVWGAFGLALSILMFAGAAFVIQRDQSALADELLKLKDESIAKAVRLAQLEEDMEKEKRQRAAADILMTLARPPRKDEDEGRLFALALKPWADQKDVPCIRKLAMAVVEYRAAKSFEGREAAWLKIRDAREECENG